MARRLSLLLMTGWEVLASDMNTLLPVFKFVAVQLSMGMIFNDIDGCLQWK